MPVPQPPASTNVPQLPRPLVASSDSEQAFVDSTLPPRSSPSEKQALDLIAFPDCVLGLNSRSRRRTCRLIRTTCFRYTTKRSRDGQNRTDCVRLPRPRPSSSLSLSGGPCFQDTRTTGAPHPEFANDPCGIRTQPGQFEGLATSPEVERALSVCVCLSVCLCVRTISVIVGTIVQCGPEGARILLFWSSARRPSSFSMGISATSPKLYSELRLRRNVSSFDFVKTRSPVSFV